MVEEPAEDVVAVIGAGIIGCAVCWALTRAGRHVLLLDRAPPATAGASFGNAGHIASEQVQTLPSPALLAGFWRELFRFGGPLDIPPRRLWSLAPWLARFAVAALQQGAHSRALAPLIRHSADALETALEQVGRRDLLRRNGHYELWLGPQAAQHASNRRRRAAALQIATQPIPARLLPALCAGKAGDGVWFPDSAHVLDPALVARAFVAAAVAGGAAIRQTFVSDVQPRERRIEIATQSGTLSVRTAIVCAGAWSASMLAPFGLLAPLEAERGYHVELRDHPPLVDAPVVYAEHSMVVTPMTSRLRCTGFLEFAGLDAPPDSRKPERLRAALRQLGYCCERSADSWMGPRPTLPDYLPGIGRAATGHELFYAVGHQHLGLTLAAVTAQIIADLVCGQHLHFDIAPLDLRRFGRP
ncbi:MAG TPA: FAD-binding oxidoreductase [Steroidobacteraceae bacterium]